MAYDLGGAAACALHFVLPYMSIASLRAEWRKADVAYRLGNPTGYTDQEFDELTLQLRKLMPHAPELQVPGGGSALLSLDTGETFMSWYSTLPVKTSLVVQPKIDGCAVALTYVDGVLSAACTRSGRDVLDRMKMIAGVPPSISQPGLVQVNGELYHPGFADKPSKSQQRAAVHLNKKPNPDGLRFCAYTLVCAQDDESQSRSLLRKWNFETLDALACTQPQEVERLHQDWVAGRLFASWPTDGIVVKVHDHAVQKRLGASKKAPKWALAMKRFSSFDDSDYD